MRDEVKKGKVKRSAGAILPGTCTVKQGVPRPVLEGSRDRATAQCMQVNKECSALKGKAKEGQQAKRGDPRKGEHKGQTKQKGKQQGGIQARAYAYHVLPYG